MIPVWAAAMVLSRPRRTVLHWAVTGRIPAEKDAAGRWLVDGAAATVEHERARRLTS